MRQGQVWCAKKSQAPSLKRLSFPLLSNDSKEHSQRHSQKAVVLRSDGSRCVASGRTDAVSQAPANVAFGHEKAAGDATSRFSELERAKRLELSEQNSEVIEIKSDVESRDSGCTQIDTHGDAEFAEIAAAWPTLPPEIRAAVLTLIRVTIGASGFSQR